LDKNGEELDVKSLSLGEVQEEEDVIEEEFNLEEETYKNCDKKH